MRQMNLGLVIAAFVFMLTSFHLLFKSVRSDRQAVAMVLQSGVARLCIATIAIMLLKVSIV